MAWMATDHCDACRHEVPAGRWCNWCGTPLAPLTRPVGHRTPNRWVVVMAGLVAVIAGVVVVAGRGPDPAVPGVAAGAGDTDVVLDVTAAGPVPERTPEAVGAIVVERPGGPPIPPPQGCSRAPRGREDRMNGACRDLPARTDLLQARTEVVCSDLRVRAVPDAELATTEKGALVDLAHGPCVVMGPEGTGRS